MEYKTRQMVENHPAGLILSRRAWMTDCAPAKEHQNIQLIIDFRKIYCIIHTIQVI